MDIYPDYYRAIEPTRIDYALTTNNLLLLGLTLAIFVTGIAVGSLPLMAISGVFAVATGASMQSSMISKSNPGADAKVR